MADSRSDDEKRAIVTGTLVTALTAVLALLELLKQSSEHLKWISNLPLWLRVLMYAGLAWFALTRIWRGLRRKSRVQDGNALRINPNNPQHLRGRVEEIEKIIDLLPDHPIIFLAGESGSGKSFLVQQGLIPALEKPQLGKARFLALYVENYGLDRDLGPARNLRAAFAGVAAHPAPAVQDDWSETQQLDATFRWLDQLSPGTGKPLLIFDQLDDYIAGHSAFFRRAGTWLARADLIKQSGFWRRIDTRLRKGALQVLFINRSDETDANPTFSLHGPVARHRPSGVPAGELIHLISTLGAAAISLPEAGWKDFRDALAEQILLAKPFLPIRAHFILSALADGVLPYLHPRTLAQIGGIDGLEAAWVAERVARLAGDDPLLKTQLSNVLLQLAHRQPGGQFKTYALSGSEIRKLLPSREDKDSDDLLRQLAAAKLLRLRSAAGPNATWALYHDYLAAIVHRAFAPRHEREEWLAERSQHWDNAETLGEKWRRLLRLRELREVLAAIPLRLLVKTRGRFLAASLAARTLPLLLLLCACGTLLWQQYQRELAVQSNGAVLATLVAGAEAKSVADRQAVVELANGSWPLKRAALHRALIDEKLAAQWLEAREIIFAAAVGWDETGALRRHLYAVVENELHGLQADGSGWQLALWLQARAVETLRPREEKLLKPLVARVRARIEKEPESLPWQLTLLKADSFWRLAPRDLKERAREILLAQIERDHAVPIGNDNLFLASRQLVEVFDQRVFDRLAAVLMGGLKDDQNLLDIQTYLQVGLPFAQPLVDAFMKLLRAQQEPPVSLTNVAQNDEFAQLVPLFAKATATDAKALAPLLFQWIEKEKEDQVSITREEVVDLLSKHFPSEKVTKWSEHTETSRRSSDYVWRELSFLILGEILDRLTEEQIQRTTEEFFAFLDKDQAFHFGALLPHITGRLAMQFTAEERSRLIQVYTDLFASTKNDEVNHTENAQFSLAMLAALRPAIPPQELSLLWTRLGPIVLAKAEATQKQTSGEDVKLWVDAATLWQDLPTGADREALAGALLSVHHAELKRPAETSQGSEVNLCHALAKFLGDKPTELAAVRDELRKLFAGASKREDALFYGACWRALGGLNSRDAPALAAWLGEADSNAIIGGYSWEPPLTEILIGALGEIFTLSFTDRWGFTEWARKNHPELLRVSRPPRSDNVNPKAEAPVHPVS